MTVAAASVQEAEKEQGLPEFTRAQRLAAQSMAEQSFVAILQLASVRAGNTSNELVYKQQVAALLDIVADATADTVSPEEKEEAWAAMERYTQALEGGDQILVDFIEQ